MRLPNAYGGVTKLKGNRRKPYWVRITDHWETDDNGKRKQIYRTIGYYATREEALTALAEYHKNPVIAPNQITFAEVYDQWSAEKFPSLSQSAIRTHETSYKICEPLHHTRFADLRLAQLQGVIDGCGKNMPVLVKIKSTLVQMFTHAMKHDIVQKNYATYINLYKYQDDTVGEQKHKIFSSDEVQALWDHADESRDIRVILIMICSGLRISELLELKKEDVHLDERWFAVREAKTESGIRVVPIASVVLPFWQELMDINGTYFYPNPRFPDDPMSYRGFNDTHFKKPLHIYGISDHNCHDTRYTFISILTGAKVLPVVIKRITGHKSKDVTERVYTQFEIRQLIETIDVPDFKRPYMESKLVL